MNPAPVLLYRTTDWMTEVQLRADFSKRVRLVRHLPAGLTALADVAVARWLSTQDPAALNRNTRHVHSELATISTARARRTRAALAHILTA